MDHESPLGEFLPYRGPWGLADVRRYFARRPGPLSMSLVSQRVEADLDWRDVTFVGGFEGRATATVVLPQSGPVTRGVALAHGGDDGRSTLRSEAAALATRGAAVILPVARIRLDDGIDAFATDVRDAVLTGRAALDVLLDAGAPPDALSFLGHSAGGALAAIMSAVESRLARIAIFGNGAGPAARSALARQLSRGSGGRKEDLGAVTAWFDLAHFVGVDRRAPLLVQHGRADQLVPVKAAGALFDAAAQPKLWMAYDCAHGLDADPQARSDRAEFVMS